MIYTKIRLSCLNYYVQQSSLVVLHVCSTSWGHHHTGIGRWRDRRIIVNCCLRHAPMTQEGTNKKPFMLRLELLSHLQAC